MKKKTNFCSPHPDPLPQGEREFVRPSLQRDETNSFTLLSREFVKSSLQRNEINRFMPSSKEFVKSSLQTKGILINRFMPLLMALASIAFVAYLARAPLHNKFIWNSTASIPEGLYYLSCSDAIKPGDIVYFPIPDSVKKLVVDERRWLNENCSLMKEVVAVEGDFVCVNGSSLRVKNTIGSVSPTDSLGRPLPSISWCGPLHKGQLFVGDISNAYSFDSRYFGPIDINDVRGVATPIWTF
jgi:conjugative transfer signal peptidase TraF